MSIDVRYAGGFRINRSVVLYGRNVERPDGTARSASRYSSVPTSEDPAMMRVFRDDAGREWTVFAVTRGEMFGGEVQFLPHAFADGWLVFQTSSERYRLAPIPERWASVSASELSEFLSSAMHPHPQGC